MEGGEVSFGESIAVVCNLMERTRAVSNEGSEGLAGVIYALRYQGGGSD
jgi:hypothetical protein